MLYTNMERKQYYAIGGIHSDKVMYHGSHITLSTPHFITRSPTVDEFLKYFPVTDITQPNYYLGGSF